MSKEIAVEATRVGKRYRLGQLHGGYQLLTETLTQRMRSLGKPREKPRELWALEDVSFEVEQGETFGIIGHNGAGKSTLLKILSRVTAPTEGEIRLRGRVGALLEVGTGFHPELTGRENVYLNGAILGMRRAEIASKFDEIIDFAEVEQFIDTPVKRYSTGMYLRLAFAVAAHLEPEILIVDEVLSVGDLAFQEKCLGRMEKVAGEGRTVVFVSHNLAAVRKLCPRSLLLERGRKLLLGPTDHVVSTYIGSVRREVGTRLDERNDRDGSGRLRFTEIAFESSGQRLDSPMTGQDFAVVLNYETSDAKPIRNVNFAVAVYSLFGELMLHLHTDTTGTIFRTIPSRGEIRCLIPRCPLPAGQYTLNVWADAGGEALDWVQRASQLTVTEGDFFGSGRGQLPSHPAVLVDHAWELSEHGPKNGSSRPATVERTAESPVRDQ
jgi:homopolymeric O-antigen transport system ATP-binding protein